MNYSKLNKKFIHYFYIFTKIIKYMNFYNLTTTIIL